MFQQNKKIQTLLVSLGLSFLVACGPSLGGSEGVLFIAREIPKIRPVINPPVEVPTVFNEVIVFATQDVYAGDISILAPSESVNLVRDAADLLCESFRTDAMNGREVRALLSISNLDQIKDMPLNFSLPINKPFVGDLGIEIAKDFEDLLDGAIDKSIKDSVEGFSFGDLYWTGSLVDGSVDVDTCSSWESNIGLGTIGSAEQMDGAWLKVGNTDCSDLRKLLCVAF